MNLLDLDLYFFLDKIAYGRRGKRRLSSRRFHPHAPNDVRGFLEKQCGLSQRNRLPGRFIEEHHEAFAIMRQQAAASAPLNVTHVDAHGDLSFGDAAWRYILETLLGQSVATRTPPVRGPGKLNQGNYLAYALACRLIARLEYVHHPLRNEDLNRYFFRHQNVTAGYIEMPYVPNGIASALSDFDADIWGMGKAYEPPIPFTLTPGPAYQAQQRFDFAILCRSPAYTPKSADALVSVFEEYIDFA